MIKVTPLALTETQAQIVAARGKNLLVSAGAGTGKTRVLVERFLSCVISGEAKVTEILALTFTEKAAQEMKVRLLERFSELGKESEKRDLESAYISTFHAFAARVLKDHPLESGLDPDFRVVESDESELLQEKAMDAVIEKTFSENPDGIYFWMERFGEYQFREGIRSAVQAAWQSGSRFTSWASKFLFEPDPNLTQTIAGLFLELGQEDLHLEWMAWSSTKSWDWEKISAFRSWCAPFSRRGGKQDKPRWKELKASCDQFAAEKVEGFAAPLRPVFEKIAADFEMEYQRLKRESGALDFADLEIRLLELLESQKPECQKVRVSLSGQFKFMMVDEFQDTSELQDRLIERLAPAGSLMRVGDYKQSIYAFRGASPELFLEKMSLAGSDSGTQCISLMDNFRSEKPVLEFINACFSKLWEEDGIRVESLIAGRLRDGLQVNDPVLQHLAELISIEKQDGESLPQARLREARAVAEQIERYHQNGVPYGGMAILFQAMTSSPIYEQALKERGIPFFVVSGRGFYHQPEIRDALNLLTVLENPLLDIPLAAVLRSPFFKVSEESLFWISQASKKESDEWPLFFGIQALLVSGDRQAVNVYPLKDSEKNKLSEFLKLFSEGGKLSGRLSLSELLEWIFEKTGLAVKALSGPQGVRRFSNLKKLVDLAREFESREWASAAAFTARVKSLENREVRESEAQIEAEQSGRVVRLMSVHAAKGLEFPIVFVADLGHKKTSSDFRGILADSRLGWSARVWNDEEADWENPASWILMDEELKAREKREWKRLFYVALTRAQSRIVLSGVSETGKKQKTHFSEMNTWMDWMLGLQPELADLMRIVVPSPQESFQMIQKSNTRKNLIEKLKTSAETQTKEDSSLIPQIEKQIAPIRLVPSRVVDLPVSAYREKVSKDRGGFVAELEDEISHDEEIVSEVETPITVATDFGTRVHRVLEFIDAKTRMEEVEEWIRKIFAGSLETEMERAKSMVQNFLGSEFFLKLKQAKRIYRELPFVLNERHGRIFGVIDVLFQNRDGSWSVLDYKTSAGNVSKVEAGAYDLQLSIYGLAVQRLLKIVPREGLIHFLGNNWTHRMEFSDVMLMSFESSLRQIQDSFLVTV